MIIIEKKALAPAMKKLASIAGKKATLPILTHVAVDFDGSTLTMTANDLQAVYSVKLPASGDPCQFTLEADKLNRSVSSMRDGQIEITEGQIKQGRSRLKLDTMPYSVFPMPAIESMQPLTCTGDELALAVSIVRHTAARQDVRHYLNGVALDSGHAVATDGHRMSWVELDTGHDETIIIPSAAIDQIINMTGDVSVNASLLKIENDSERYSTQLITGKYPDWQRVIPKEPVSVTVNAKTQDAIEALSIVANGGDGCRMVVCKNECGLTNEKADAVFDCTENGGIEIGLKVQYMIDAIKNSGGESLTIEFRDAMSSVVINGNQLVMPMRL